MVGTASWDLGACHRDLTISFSRSGIAWDGNPGVIIPARCSETHDDSVTNWIISVSLLTSPAITARNVSRELRGVSDQSLADLEGQILKKCQDTHFPKATSGTSDARPGANHHSEITPRSERQLAGRHRHGRGRPTSCPTDSQIFRRSSNQLCRLTRRGGNLIVGPFPQSRMFRVARIRYLVYPKTAPIE